MAAIGIKILEVEKGSPADRLGLKAGDRILAANGHEVADELALKFYLSEEDLDFYVRQSGGHEKHFKVNLTDHADLGIRVEEFRTRTCNNACLFCFIDQLPRGVRPSLRIKDDDYRLSFLHGNYITLTNLSENDLDRIVEQRLSPLFVSIHATDPALRTRILGRKRADDLGKKLGKLVRGGIRLHTQIVLMPGINDGIHLEQTLLGLYHLYPGIQSAAIVPLGLSEHGKPKDHLEPVTPEYSRALIQKMSRWQDRFRAQIGRAFAYLADEFYVQGGVAIPEREHYDDFAQIEDGVGMIRDFLDDFEAELRRRRRFRLDLHGSLATGRLFSPILQRCIARFNRRFGSGLQVCQIENRFLGKSITVAGLLGGHDILAGLSGVDIGDFLIIPNEALSRNEGILVDNLLPENIARNLGKPVFPSGRTLHDFFDLLIKLSKSRPPDGTWPFCGLRL